MTRVLTIIIRGYSACTQYINTRSMIFRNNRCIRIFISPSFFEIVLRLTSPDRSNKYDAIIIYYSSYTLEQNAPRHRTKVEIDSPLYIYGYFYHFSYMRIHWSHLRCNQKHQRWNAIR